MYVANYVAYNEIHFKNFSIDSKYARILLHVKYLIFSKITFFFFVLEYVLKK